VSGSAPVEAQALFMSSEAGKMRLTVSERIWLSGPVCNHVVVIAFFPDCNHNKSRGFRLNHYLRLQSGAF
jgi:hypothetical protein